MIIKQSPEDFIVEEIPIEFSGKGDYAIYKLIKKDYNTESAVEYVCRKFGINRRDVKYAGSKDRKAITTQYISIYKDKGKLNIDSENVRLEFVIFHNEPLSLGSLKGNKFLIRIRDIAHQEIKNSGFMPNYYDEQRFSKHNFHIGLALLKKDYEKAVSMIDDLKLREHLKQYPNDFVGALKQLPLKILTLYVHAVQSYIFNEALYRTLRDRPGFDVEYSLGKMRFTEYHDYSKLPLPGFDTKAEGKIQAVLQELGLKTSNFIVRALPELSVEESFRECYVPVSGFSYEWSDGLVLKFALPKGSYATVFLKATLNNNINYYPVVKKPKTL